MIGLTEEQHALLERICAAGAAGHVIKQGELGTALWFGVHGLAEITNSKTPPQRAVITARGRAFTRRTAA